MSEHTYTILIIDDEKTIRVTLAALLEQTNYRTVLLEKSIYRVEMAGDGVEGLELARQINPDLILLDIMMPRMNGYDVCKRIRSDPQIADVPIIMITALNDRDAKLNGLVAGADDFLTKPFDSLELEIRLHTLKRVNRYRRLLEERKKLDETFEELSTKNEQLRALSRQVLEAQEDERRRMAVELNDGVGHLVTGLKLILERKRGDSPTMIGEARAVANELLERVREMSINRRPAEMNLNTLAATIQNYTGKK